MQEGNVIRFALQQHDGRIVRRPAVLLKKNPPFNDWLICGISKSTGLEVKGLDVLITQNDADFKTWGLDFPGIIRTGFLTTISIKYIEGALGHIHPETHNKILNNIVKFLSAY